jgi:predicted cupin superfamily sugar epimerase
MTAANIIEQLQLVRHPEGGYYRETYRGTQSLALPNGNERSSATAIYYLLEGNDKSHFHRVASDELWLFHQGQPLELLMITADGTLDVYTLGNQLQLDQKPQIVIPAHHWFAARVQGEQGYALVSCVVAPGFDFADFELADKEQLLSDYPLLRSTIEPLCI